MKKVITLIIVVLFTALLSSGNFVQADTGDKKPVEQTQKNNTPPVKLTYPLPFLSDQDALVGESFDKKNIKEGTIQKVKVAGQEVPVFEISRAGLRFIITALFFIAGPITLAVIVYSGVMLVVKADNEEEATKTRRTLIFSTIGLLIMALAYAIVQNIIKIFE